MLDDVRGVEEGAVDYGTWGRLTRQNSGFHVLLRVLFVMSGQGGTDVDTSAGALSEAKTQRRPHSARERESGRGGNFVNYVKLKRGRRGESSRCGDKVSGVV